MPNTISRLQFPLIVAITLALASGCEAEVSEIIAATPAPSAPESRYKQGAPNYDGIGKQYLGREISHVMGHRGAGWLERPERERTERTDLLIELLPIEPDSVIADIGAGTGYFSFPMARKASEGRVIAVDIQQEMLDIIKARQEEGAPANVDPLLSTESDPTLPANSVDLALIVDAYHEFSYPYEMGIGIVKGLKPGGLLALVEYRGEDPTVPIKRLHKMTEAQSKLEMDAIGLEWVETIDALPQQHLMLFRKPAETQDASLND